MSKNFFTILLLVVIIISSFGNVNADSYRYINQENKNELLIEDDASLLTVEEINNLSSDMMPLTQYGNIVFKSINENSSSTSQYAEDFYFNKYGEKSGTIFLFDMFNRMIYIYSEGENYKTITKSKADIITDNVYTYASRKDYYQCASVAFEQMNTLLDGGKILEPMRYIGNILIATVSGFLFVFIWIQCGSKLKKSSNKDILKNCKIKFDVKKVTAQKTGEHKEYSPQSSSGSSHFSSGGGHSYGGGHSSGGGSHSSHSSGGGGGHRF